ncbi:MAG: ComEC/Rec2 family competence protein [Clostridia bacterium]
MQEIKVNNVIIGKQYEKCENYKKFIEIVKKKNIKVNVVEAGQKINIERNLFFDVLWPCIDNMISENAINNNSLVCKLKYKNFSMLFTGDIEEIAEKAILAKYSKNKNILKADVLKVAHHGSKTSSTIDFLKAVKPNYAVIGVGKDNNFGHPSDITIQNLKDMGVKIYRTDEIGEIEIKGITKNKIKKK